MKNKFYSVNLWRFTPYVQYTVFLLQHQWNELHQSPQRLSDMGHDCRWRKAIWEMAEISFLCRVAKLLCKSWELGEELFHPGGVQSRTAALEHQKKSTEVVQASDQNVHIATSLWRCFLGAGLTGRRLQGRTRTCRTNYISSLVWEQIGKESVIMAWDIWLSLLDLLPPWPDG